VGVAGLLVGGLIGRASAPDEKVITRTVAAEGDVGATGTTGPTGPGMATPPAGPAEPPCNPGPQGARSKAYEPNPRRRPFGPLVRDASYGRAAIEAEDDEDWYVLCTAGPQELRVEVTLLEQGPQGCGLEAALKDDEGTTVAAVAHPRQLQVPASITHEAAEPARFLVTISGPLTPSSGCRYSLRVESDEDLSRNAPSP
jgi:hypothetical protein